jgi:acetyl esterase/lipase
MHLIHLFNIPQGIPVKNEYCRLLVLFISLKEEFVPIMRLKLHLIFVILIGWVAVGCEENKPFNTRVNYYNVSYGPDPLHTMDVALPKNRTVENTPVVIFIHGGGWHHGDKYLCQTEMNQMANYGIAAVSVNYRLAYGSNPASSPDCSDDIRLAIDYIISQSAEWEISPERFGLAGHSSGGHLALYTSYVYNADNVIKACVAGAAPADLWDSTQLAIPDMYTYITAYVNQSILDSNMYKMASPYWVASYNEVPTLLIYGENDEYVPYSIGMKLKAKLDALGVENQFTTLPGASHVWTNAENDQTRLQTIQWFQDHL